MRFFSIVCLLLVLYSSLYNAEAVTLEGYLSDKIKETGADVLDATAQIPEEVRQDMESGSRVFNLSVGSAGHDTPLGDQRGKYSSSKGDPDLVNNVVKFYKTRRIADFSADDIVITSGGRDALFKVFNVITSTANTEVEVLIPSPYYASYQSIINYASNFSTKITYMPTTVENDFKISVEELKKYLNPDKLQILAFNTPSNPTGSIYSSQELRDIAEFVIANPNILILSDEPYIHLVYNTNKAKNYSNYLRAPNILDRDLLSDDTRKRDVLDQRVIIAYTLSKDLGMVQTRVGWAATKNRKLNALILQSINANQYFISRAAQQDALDALKAVTPKYIKGVVKFNKEKRDVVYNALKDAKLIGVSLPEGALYVVVSVNNIIGLKLPNGKVINGSKDFYNYLKDTYHVYVIPGSAFGDDTIFRIAYSYPSQDDLRESCGLITKAFHDIYMHNS